MAPDEPPLPGAAGGTPERARHNLVWHLLAGDWLTARRVFWLTFAGAAAMVPLIMFVQLVFVLHAPEGKGLHFDFAAFWAASTLSLEGSPALAYDIEAGMRLQEAATGRDGLEDMPWIYPPTFQVVVLPLGLLPMIAAKIVWSVVTCAFFLAVVWAILPERAAIYAAVASPITFVLFLNGQTGFLTAGLTGLGLIWWHRRPVLAGVAFGLMSIKPQLVIGGPVAAIAARNWRVLGAALVTGTALAALSLLLLGAETWRAYPDALRHAGELYRDLVHTWHFHAVAYGALRTLGLGAEAAMVAQAAVTLGAGVLLVRGLRDPGLAPDAKSALLAYGMLAVTPRAMDYDLLPLFLGALFQIRHARAYGYFAGERTILLGAAIISYLDYGLPFLQVVPFLALDAVLAPMLLAALMLGERYRPGHAGAMVRAWPGDALAAAFVVQAGRFARFGVVGVAATLTHVAALTGLVELAGMDPRIANLAGVALAVPVSYVGHYYWSFGSRHPHGETLIRFVVVALCSLAGSQGLMLFALDVLGAPYGVGIVLMVVIMPVVNFAVQQALVFRRRPRVPGRRDGTA